MLEISKIRTDGSTQARASLDQDAIADYAEAYRAGAAMPPVMLFYDGAHYWLADGFHRLAAAKLAGLLQIQEEITPGSLDDAILYGLGANAQHGLRRTNADKRHAVEKMLKHPVWATWSNSEMARRCCVSPTFVAEVRASLSTVDSEPPERVYTTKHGTTANMKTANIGKKPGAPHPAPTPDVADAEPEYNPADDELAEAHETVRNLAEENERLKDAIAVGNLPEPERSAGEIIAELRKEVKTLTATLEAVTESRDQYMRENASMKKQCAVNQRELKKLRAGAP